MDVASQSTVCEWHQFQGLNEVIYSQYRQNFRACGGLRGNLITPSRTRPPVGARLVVPTHWSIFNESDLSVVLASVVVGYFNCQRKFTYVRRQARLSLSRLGRKRRQRERYHAMRAVHMRCDACP
jgi:hypothetical protein